jgi:hypothetical protein
MSFLPKKPYYIGIAAEKSIIKIAAVRKQGKKWALSKLKEIPATPAASPIDPLLTTENIISVIDSKDVLIRQLDLPLDKKAEVLAAIHFQSATLLPYPPSEGVLHTDCLFADKGKSHINIYAVKKEAIKSHIKQLDALDIVPDKTVSAPQALARFASTLTTNLNPQLLVYIAEPDISCVLVSGGFPIKHFTISAQKSLATELKKISLSLAQYGKAGYFEKIILCGQATDELRAALSEQLDKPISFPESTQYDISSDKLRSFALAIGAALTWNWTENFSKGFISSERFMAKLRHPLTFLCSALAALCIGTALLGWASISHKKRVISQQFEKLLQQEGRAPLSFENEKDFFAHIQSLNEDIQNRKDTFALFPIVPTVSEFMSWVSRHPILNKNSDIKVQAIHYSLIKRPTSTRPRECYQVKVLMDIVIKNPDLAKNLQELLSQEMLMIDHRHDVQWSSGKDNHYHVGFILKDKTRYS